MGPCGLPRARAVLALCLGRLLTACSAGAAADATGRVFHVAKNGNDAQPGTQARPWRTVAKAAETAAAGDTVLFHAGTYHEVLFPANSGTAGREIVFAAFEQDLVVLDGTGFPLSQGTGVVDLTKRGFIRVAGLRVQNSQDLGIGADGAHDITVANCLTSNTASSGIGLWSCRRVVVEGNTITGAGTGGRDECLTIGGTDTFEVRRNVVRDGRKEGLCIKDGSANGRVFLNEVYDIYDGVGIYVDAEFNHTHDIEVTRNVVHDVQVPGKQEGVGISLASESGALLENVVVTNNLVYHNKALGLQVTPTGPAATHPMRRLKIINNTVVSNGWEPWGGGIALDDPDITEVLVRNNLCSRNLTFQLLVSAVVPAGQVTVDHNLAFPFLGIEPGEVTGTAAVRADPRLTDPAGADFHLAAGSPAVDAGARDQAPAEDFDGVPRPRGRGVDIGALERP